MITPGAGFETPALNFHLQSQSLPASRLLSCISPLPAGGQVLIAVRPADRFLPVHLLPAALRVKGGKSRKGKQAVTIKSQALKGHIIFKGCAMMGV